MRNQIILRILLSMIMLLDIIGCSTLTKSLLKDPIITTESLSLSSADFQKITLNLKLKVENPNAINLHVDQLDYALTFDGESVTEGVFQSGLEIPAEGAGAIDIPLTFKYRSLSSIFNKLLKKSSSAKPYELNGHAQVGFFKVPFSKKGEINLTL